MASDHMTWMSTCPGSAGRSPLEPDDQPEQHSREASITSPVAKVAAAYAGAVAGTGCRGMAASAALRKELFGDSVHCRDQDQQQSRALVGMAEDRADLLLQPPHEHPGKSQAQEHRIRGRDPTELERPQGEPAHGPAPAPGVAG